MKTNNRQIGRRLGDAPLVKQQLKTSHNTPCKSLPSSCHICHFHDNPRELCSIGVLFKGTSVCVCTPVEPGHLGFCDIKISFLTHVPVTYSNKARSLAETYTKSPPAFSLSHDIRHLTQVLMQVGTHL